MYALQNRLSQVGSDALNRGYTHDPNDIPNATLRDIHNSFKRTGNIEGFSNTPAFNMQYNIPDPTLNICPLAFLFNNDFKIMFITSLT